MKRFEGKAAIVTGGSGGIGSAIAARLGSEGCRVVLAALTQPELDKAAELTKAAGAPDAFGMVCDVSDEAQVEATAKACIDRFGRIDAIVNNAGLMSFKALPDFTEDDWLKVLKVDLLGAMHFTRQAFQHMQKGGAIVNIAAKAAFDHAAGASAYAASKAAAVAMVECLAEDLRGTGVRVNSVLPSIIDTPANRRAMPNADFAKWPKPEDIARVILFLCSDEARLIHGAAIPVYGNG